MSKNRIFWERVRAMADEMPQNGEFVMLNGDEVTKISLDMVRTIDYTNDGVEILFLFKNEVSKFPMGRHDADRLMEQFIAYKTDSPWTFEFEEFVKNHCPPPLKKPLPTSGTEIKAI